MAWYIICHILHIHVLSVESVWIWYLLQVACSLILAQLWINTTKVMNLLYNVILCTCPWPCYSFVPLQWRHNEHHGMVSQITSIWTVCSVVCSGTLQRKHQSSFVRGIHRWLLDSPHKGPVTRKCFHLMTSILQCTKWPAEKNFKNKDTYNRINVGIDDSKWCDWNIFPRVDSLIIIKRYVKKRC